MTEQQQAQASQEQTEGQAQEATNEQPQEQDSGGKEEQTFSREYVEKLRQEAAANRKRAQALEKEQKKREDAEKTELEKANSELEHLREQVARKTERVRKANVIADVKVPNAKYAWMAAQEAGIELEFDDDDRLTNADAVSKALKKHDPDLFGTGSADAGETGRTQVTNGDPKAAFLAQQLGL